MEESLEVFELSFELFKLYQIYCWDPEDIFTECFVLCYEKIKKLS